MVEKQLKKIKKAVKKGFTKFYYGSAASDSDEIGEQLLVSLELHHCDDNLMIEKDADF